MFTFSSIYTPASSLTHFHPVISCHFQASEEPEERETLALMAARGDSEETQDGETYIEKYTRGVLEVENILSLERLRQVLLKKKNSYMTNWSLKKVGTAALQDKC